MALRGIRCLRCCVGAGKCIDELDKSRHPSSPLLSFRTSRAASSRGKASIMLPPPLLEVDMARYMLYVNAACELGARYGEASRTLCF